MIKLYETKDSASIRRAVENGLLLLYNTMTNPQDEERLTTEFCAQEGTISFVRCICATRELLDAKSKDEQSAEAATPDDKEMWKCYKILLDMIINFSYTSKQLCAELLQHELPNILISDLLNLRDTFMHSKVCIWPLEGFYVNFNQLFPSFHFPGIISDFHLLQAPNFFYNSHHRQLF